ncbi:MAG TPA: T9SS type A sorting domain-containing protein [Candidatus Kapabacteria bacterium]|nr:T9SS type A sorting domain-containing protein [Candidatus Kapabacteria bacterium]
MAVRSVFIFAVFVITGLGASAQTYSSSPVNADTAYRSNPIFEGDTTGIVDSSVVLGQNYPNPFSSSTDFRFQIVDPSLYGKEVNVSVFDMVGHTVKMLYEYNADAAVHTLTFNAAGLRPGRYTYRLRCGGHQAARLMSVIAQQ